MNTLHRIFWLLTLCAFVSGCSGYRLAALPGGDGTAAPADSVAVVGPGSLVRVTMNTGEAHKGKVSRITGEELVLAADEVGPRETRVLALRDVESVEISKGTALTKGFVVVVAVAAAWVVWAIIDCATHDYSYSGS